MDDRLTDLMCMVCVVAHTRIAIPLALVHRVESAVEVTPLNGAPKAVLGVIDFHGEIRPVYSARARLGYSQPPVTPSGKLVMLETDHRSVSLLVDEVDAIEAIGSEAAEIRDSFSAGSLGLRGLAQSDDGLMIVLDMDQFLTVDEDTQLSDALNTFKQGR